VFWTFLWRSTRRNVFALKLQAASHLRKLLWTSKDRALFDTCPLQYIFHQPCWLQHWECNIEFLNEVDKKQKQTEVEGEKHIEDLMSRFQADLNGEVSD